MVFLERVGSFSDDLFIFLFLAGFSSSTISVASKSMVVSNDSTNLNVCRNQPRQEWVPRSVSNHHPLVPMHSGVTLLPINKLSNISLNCNGLCRISLNFGFAWKDIRRQTTFQQQVGYIQQKYKEINILIISTVILELSYLRVWVISNPMFSTSMFTNWTSVGCKGFWTVGTDIVNLFSHWKP